MSFIVFEAADLGRLSVLPLDGATENPVREVCRGESLADVANALDAAEVAAVRARLRTGSAAMAEFRRGLVSAALGAGLVPAGAVPIEVSAPAQ